MKKKKEESKERDASKSFISSSYSKIVNMNSTFADEDAVFTAMLNCKSKHISIRK
jgi:hypothetical protein